MSMTRPCRMLRHLRPLPAALLAATIFAAGCKPRQSTNAVAPDAGAAASTPQAVTLPPEPTPPVADKANDVPKFEADLAKDPAYQGLWSAPRADVNLYLTDVSELLAYGGASADITKPLEKKKLEPSAIKLMLIFWRIGRFPDDFTQKLTAHLAEVKAESNLGTWAPYTKGGPIQDFTALAAWLQPQDPAYLRQHIAAKSTNGPSPWSAMPDGKPPARPWLVDEAAALDRLALFGPLTAAETARVAALKADASQPKLGQDFKLGDFTYNVKSVDVVDSVGNSFTKKVPSEGARFVVVHYAIRNDANQTLTVSTDDFRIVDTMNREFRQSSDANTALALSGSGKDFLVTELQPGIKKQTATAFELPAEVANGMFTLVIPEKGLLGTGSVRIKLK